MRRLSEGRLLVATHNAGKLEEMRALFAPAGVEVVGAAELGLPAPAETEDSFVGNARIKARAAMAATGLLVLADAVLAATVFHFGTLSIRDVKAGLSTAGHPVR